MLSLEAVRFLSGLFQRRCHPGTGTMSLDLLLNDTGPSSLFHNAPPALKEENFPLRQSYIEHLLIDGSDDRNLTLEGFLCLWAYCALVDARQTVKALLYVGFPDSYGSECAPTSS
jgi:hypothetical protein